MSIINSVSTVFKNKGYQSVAAYIFTNFFSKGISLLLLPLFTNPAYLTPADNGLLSLFSSNLMLLSPLICLGMLQSANADFFKKSKVEFAQSLTGSFFIAFILMIFSIVLLYIFKNLLQSKFDFPASFVFIIPALVFLTFCSEQFFTLLRNRNEVKNFTFFGITKALIEYAVAVILIVFFFKGWLGRVYGIAISLIAINLFSCFYLYKKNYLQLKITKAQIWEEVKFGLPIFVTQLCVFMLGSTNKLFLAIYNVDKEKLGVYAIACLFGSLVGYLGQSILLYAQPKLFKAISSGEAAFMHIKKLFLEYLKIFSIVAIICIAVVFFVFYFVINKLYQPGIPFFLIVALSSFIWNLNYYFFLFLLYYKAKRLILKISLISIIFSIITNIILVKNFLILGDAIASLINTIVFGVLVFVFSKKFILKAIQKI